MNRFLPAVWILFAWMPVGAAPNCVTDADCLKPGWVCEFPVGDCARQNGTCHPTPTCDPTPATVCGCNDIGFGPTTYSTACGAFNAGDVVASLGACPVSCGGQTCSGNTFCQLPTGVCLGWPEVCGDYVSSGRIADRQYAIAGVCTPVPTSCSQVSDPVLGCDFVTYLNSCVAAQNQQSIIRDGAGGSGNGNCGGLFGVVCNDPSHICVCGICGVADIGGYCTPEPVTCDNSCAPVCDCSGSWHRNRCEWILASNTSPSFAISLSEFGGCDEVWGVQFLEKIELRWGSAYPGGNPPREFNVYRAVLTGGGPPSWNCVASGLATHPHVVSDTPPSGETWAFVVTKVDGGVEGPLGWGGSGCTERTNAAACPQ